MVKRLLLVAHCPESAWRAVLDEAARDIAEVDAFSEEEAFARMRQTKYDLVILDVVDAQNLPALVRRAKTQAPDVPVIVATSSPTSRRAREVFRAGASDYIRRSPDLQDLRATLREMLSNAR